MGTSLDACRAHGVWGTGSRSSVEEQWGVRMASVAGPADSCLSGHISHSLALWSGVKRVENKAPEVLGKGLMPEWLAQLGTCFPHCPWLPVLGKPSLPCLHP